MAIYNVKQIKFKNQTQVKFYKKPIEYGEKKEKKKQSNELEKSSFERTQFAIDLSVRQSIHRTKNNIWQIALSNDWEYFVTFTFNPNIINSKIFDDCANAMSNWLDNAKKRCCPYLKYLIVPEYHSDKEKFHFHALMSNMGDLKLIDSGYRKNGKPIYNIGNYLLGFSTAIPIGQNADEQSKTCGYMIKYITKDLVNLSMNKKRYWYSIKIIEKPIIENYVVETDKKESFGEALENDMVFRKTLQMPFSGNCVKIYNFDN